MAIDYTILTTELTIDPIALGYAPLIVAGSDNLITAKLNAIILNNKVKLKQVAINDFIACIVLTEYIALTQAQRDFLSMLCISTRIDLSDVTISTSIDGIFGLKSANGVTRTAIEKASKRDGSRMETLFGANVIATDYDVAKALGRG